MNQNSKSLLLKENKMKYSEPFSGIYVKRYVEYGAKKCERFTLGVGEYCAFVQKGSGNIQIDQESFAYQQYDFFFFAASAVHILSQQHSQFLFLQLQNSRFLLENQHVLWVQRAKWAALRMDYLYHILHVAHTDQYKLSVDLYSMIMDAWSAYKTLQTKFSPLVAEAREMMQQNFAYVGGVEEIADALNVNKSYLIRRFKSETGTSPGQYLQLVRIENAKILLKSRTYSVELIANMTGYASANYFCKVFLKRTGESPGHYRKRCSGLNISPKEQKQIERIEKIHQV